MDSKSIRRVSDSCRRKCWYDVKARVWHIAGKNGGAEYIFSVDEVATMSSLDFRKKIGIDQALPEVFAGAKVASAGANKALIDLTEARIKAAEAKPKKPSKAAGAQAKQPKKIKVPKAPKADAHMREHGLIKISGTVVKVWKRNGGVNKGKIWLKAIAVDKSSLKHKMELRKAGKDAMKLMDANTQHYAPADMRVLVESIFDKQDKEVLKNRANESAVAIRYAEDARATAERAIAAIRGDDIPALHKF